jgi:hypothetical protein
LTVIAVYGAHAKVWQKVSVEPFVLPFLLLIVVAGVPTRINVSWARAFTLQSSTTKALSVSALSEKPSPC